MKVKWYHLASLVVVLGVIGISFPLWTPRSTSVNVSEMSPVLEDSAAPVSTEGGSETRPGNASPLFSGGLSFDESQKKYPDQHPVVATFKSLFTDEQLQEFAAHPEMKRFLEVLESAEYAEFVTTRPTSREMDEFWAKHGFHQEQDRYQKAFREVFPTGEPEDFELEMRQTFAELFRDVDETNMEQEIINKAPQFLSDPRNRAWMAGYFEGEHLEFGAWGENILKNLNANLPEASSPEDALIREDPSASAGRVSQETDTPVEADVPKLPDSPEVEKRSETPGSPTNSESPAPDVIDVNQLLTDDSLDALFTEDGFETLLNESINAETFTIEKVQRALDVLNRYGPKEGLRKLRDSDPDVVKQMADFIRERKEN